MSQYMTGRYGDYEVITSTGVFSPLGEMGHMPWEWNVVTKTPLLDWWRCEWCHCAVPLRVNNNVQLKCTECGAPIPEKYDTR